MHEAVGTEPVGTGLLIAGITIFILAYAAIATDRIPKSAIALGGGALMILIGILNQEQAFHHVDLNVILLLVGMMILAGIVRKTGCFQALAILAARWTGGDGLRLMLALSLIPAVLSAFLDNVTTVILIAPITVFGPTRLNLNPVPFFIAEILASNVGGAATLIVPPAGQSILIDTGTPGTRDAGRFHEVATKLAKIHLGKHPSRWVG